MAVNTELLRRRRGVGGPIAVSSLRQGQRRRQPGHWRRWRRPQAPYAGAQRRAAGPRFDGEVPVNVPSS